MCPICPGLVSIRCGRLAGMEMTVLRTMFIPTDSWTQGHRSHMGSTGSIGRQKERRTRERALTAVSWEGTDGARERAALGRAGGSGLRACAAWGRYSVAQTQEPVEEGVGVCTPGL